jgi:alpha-beta hydrolase superfamily lysophospholipase
MPGYVLAPEARIAEITGQIRAAVESIAARTEGPLVLTGHSAGGHLVARMLCPDVGLPDAVRERLRRVVPISPLADLHPLLETTMNDDLRLDAAEAAAESPVDHPAPATPVHVWVGGAERPAFLDQARWLATAWDVPLTIAAERHHFDVIDALAKPESDLLNLLLAD